MSAATEEKAETPASSATVAESSGGGGNKLVLILTGVNLLVTLGMVAVLFISFQKDRKQPKIADLNPHAEAPAKAEGAEGGEKKEGEHAEGGEGKAAEKKPADYGKIITLDQFVVNLSSTGGATSRFVRLNVSLEVASEDSESEVNAKVPQVRNAIIDLFNSKRASDLATADGRDFIKEEIRNALNGFLVHGKVRGVFFTNFALSG